MLGWAEVLGTFTSSGNRVTLFVVNDYVHGANETAEVVYGERPDMELLYILTDDQKALLGCFVALILCGGLMMVSYLLGRSSRDRRSRDAAQTAGVRLSKPKSGDPHQAPEQRPRRKVA